jgi:hypothetical protein
MATAARELGLAALLCLFPAALLRVATLELETKKIPAADSWLRKFTLVQGSGQWDN